MHCLRDVDMTFSRNALLALVCLLFAGCASGPPVEYYTLVPVSGAAVTAPTRSHPVQIASVQLPGTLDRADLVRALSATHLEIDDAQQWAAPLGSMIARVLTQDLQARLGKAAAIPASAQAPADTDRVSLNILAFAPAADGTLTFDGSWSYQNPDGPVTHHSLHLTAASTAGDPSSQAQAMSNILGRIADAIAATVPTQNQAAP